MGYLYLNTRFGARKKGKLMKLLSIFTLAALLAAPLAAEPKGSDTKGKFFFKKNCKSCHVENGKAAVVTPLSKTQAQWRKVFDAGKHGRTGEGFSPKYGTPEQILDIKTFLINHASDSPQPETCGG
ncbi:c-type cytochrome [Geothrix sp. 21YS21S-2]|uniref:c-type cytochrome n=1 Tax=Geothrix sp. 21YS21S-2 TaxID=3068893 RepID=UPI0027B88662|nr:c-type cytochrome [Geothrix sp. 21YS21S-2]